MSHKKHTFLRDRVYILFRILPRPLARRRTGRTGSALGKGRAAGHKYSDQRRRQAKAKLARGSTLIKEFQATDNTVPQDIMNGILPPTDPSKKSLCLPRETVTGKGSEAQCRRQARGHISVTRSLLLDRPSLAKPGPTGAATIEDSSFRWKNFFKAREVHCQAFLIAATGEPFQHSEKTSPDFIPLDHERPRRT